MNVENSDHVEGRDPHPGDAHEQAHAVFAASDPIVLPLVAGPGSAADPATGAAGAAGDGVPVVVPVPPKRASRKRPCAKQSAGRRARAAGSASGQRPDRGQNRDQKRDQNRDQNRGQDRDRNRSAGRGADRGAKRNMYVLDPLTGLVSSVRPGTVPAAGARVVEVPPGSPRPHVAAFFDPSLLPAGSTSTTRWGAEPAVLDQGLKGRLGRLARLAGLGEQARHTMFEQLAAVANPDAAMRTMILALGGADALDAAPATLTTSADRAAVAAALAAATAAGNDEIVDFADPLPALLAPRAEMASLVDLPGMVESIVASGNGTRFQVRCFRFDDIAKIRERIVAAGGRIDRRVEKHSGELDGRQSRWFVVSAVFDAAPVEVAMARTGRNARLDYQFDESGALTARYVVDVFGEQVTTVPVPADPTLGTVERIVKELARRDTAVAALVADIAVAVEAPENALAAVIGPVRTVADAAAKTAGLTVEGILGDDWRDRVAAADRTVRARDGRRVAVAYRGGNAALDEFSFHPADLRAVQLPDTVDGPDGETPTTVRQVRFEDRKGSRHPKVVVEDVTVAELRARRERFLSRRDPVDALLVEAREVFLADATRTMCGLLVDPPESLAAARNPEAAAKSRVRRRHLDPVSAAGGDVVALLGVVADADSDNADAQSWSVWCRENTRLFRDAARRSRRNGGPAADTSPERSDAPVDFFEAVGHEDWTRSLVVDALAALLTRRLGRSVDAAEAVALAAKAKPSDEVVFAAFDRGRLLARTLRRS